MANTVIVGCKLPHGLVIVDPNNENNKVEIKGLNDSKIIGATFVTTPVDAELWARWKAAYINYPPVKSGAIFDATTPGQAEAKGKELETVKTGFEALNPAAHGVKTATDDPAR